MPTIHMSEALILKSELNRVIALYTHINYVINRGTPEMDWSSQDLTRSWGRANRRSSEDYARLLEALN